MKKYIAIVSLLLLTPLKAFAFADVEYGMWNQTANSSVNIGTPATLGPNGSSQGILAADLDLPIPVIPSLMVKTTSLYATDGSTTLNMQTFDAIAYWHFPLVKVVRWGVGLSAFPGTFTGTVSGTVPAASLVGYVGLRAKLAGFKLGYDMSQSLVSGVTASTTDMYAAYPFLKVFGVKVGKRTANYGASDGSNTFSADADGLYVSVFMHI